jgi:hypothetical protein
VNCGAADPDFNAYEYKDELLKHPDAVVCRLFGDTRAAPWNLCAVPDGEWWRVVIDTPGAEGDKFYLVSMEEGQFREFVARCSERLAS